MYSGRKKHLLTSLDADDVSSYLTHPDSPDLGGHSEEMIQSPNWWAGFPPASGSSGPCFLWTSQRGALHQHIMSHSDLGNIITSHPLDRLNTYNHIYTHQLSRASDILPVHYFPEVIPTMLMRLWPRARTSSRVRLVKAPPCRAWLVSRLWSSSKVWSRGRFLKDCSPRTEMQLWLRPEGHTEICSLHT